MRNHKLILLTILIVAIICIGIATTMFTTIPNNLTVKTGIKNAREIK